MDEAMRKKLAKGAIAVIASDVLLPIGLAVSGVPLLVIFAVCLTLTLGIWVWGFRPAHYIYVPLLVASLAFVVWANRRERAYKITYEFCRGATLAFVNDEPYLTEYYLGVRLFNDSPFTLYVRADEQSLSLGTKTQDPFESTRTPTPLYPHTQQFLMSNRLSYHPYLKLTDVPERGRIRYVVRYGRDPEALTKTLTVSGAYEPIFLRSGDSRIDFFPLPDNDAGKDPKEMCRIPTELPSGAPSKAPVIFGELPS